jgi:hypothetical protein
MNIAEYLKLSKDEQKIALENMQTNSNAPVQRATPKQSMSQLPSTLVSDIGNTDTTEKVLKRTKVPKQY